MFDELKVKVFVKVQLEFSLKIEINKYIKIIFAQNLV
jgi:hypothetical protein